MERISIPDAKPNPQLESKAGQIAIDAIREAGMDPLKAASHPMAVQVIQEWFRGEWTRADVVRILRNLTILNPALAAG